MLKKKLRNEIDDNDQDAILRASLASRESLRRFEDLEKMIDYEEEADDPRDEDVDDPIGDDPADEIDLFVIGEEKEEEIVKIEKLDEIEGEKASESKIRQSSASRQRIGDKNKQPDVEASSRPLTAASSKSSTRRNVGARPPSKQRRCRSAISAGAPVDGFFTKSTSAALKSVAASDAGVVAGVTNGGDGSAAPFLLLGVSLDKIGGREGTGREEGGNGVGKETSSSRPSTGAGSRSGLSSSTLRPASSSSTRPASSVATKRPRVSYKTYQLCPRSWRPASSLATDGPNIAETGLDTSSASQKDNRPHTSLGIEGVTTPRRNYRLQPRAGVTQGAAFPLFSRGSTPNSMAMASFNARRHFDNNTGNDPKTPREEGATSRCVIVDGDDMTSYDDDNDENAENAKRREDDDESALKQLEWELASETGRVTAEGEIMAASRLSLDDAMDGGDGNDSGMETTGSEALEQLRLQLQRELFLDVEGELHDAASADAESDYDEFNDGADEEFHQHKFKMEAEKEVSRLN